jgi:TrmH family RNA methyltransferase
MLHLERVRIAINIQRYSWYLVVCKYYLYSKLIFTVLSKNRVKHLKSLSASKFRQMYNNFVAEGHKLATEIILSKAFEIEQIYAFPEWISDNSNLITNDLSLKTIAIDSKCMKQISLLSTYSPVYILLKKPDLSVKNSLIQDKFSFMLEGVQDPGNVGTIIRIADWFGISNVITDINSADLVHPKVVQASMGSICNVNLMRLNEIDIEELCSQHPTYALTLDGTNVANDSFDKTGIIMLGSEGKGLSKNRIAKSYKNIYIPSSPSSRAESLNVAITAGIIGYNISKL